MSTTVPAPPATDRAAFGAAPSRDRQVRDRQRVPAAERNDPRSRLSARNTCRRPVTGAMSVAPDNLARAENTAAGRKTAMTNAMGRTVGEVAAGSHQISGNVAEAAAAAAATTSAATTSAAATSAAAADQVARIARDP
jgi:hypothetical protein